MGKLGGLLRSPSGHWGHQEGSRHDGQRVTLCRPPHAPTAPPHSQTPHATQKKFSLFLPPQLLQDNLAVASELLDDVPENKTHSEPEPHAHAHATHTTPSPQRCLPSFRETHSVSPSTHLMCSCSFYSFSLKNCW